MAQKEGGQILINHGTIDLDSDSNEGLEPDTGSVWKSPGALSNSSSSSGVF